MTGFSDLLFPQWFLPIIASALALGFYDVGKKLAVDRNSVMPVLFFATFSGFLFFLTVILFLGKLDVLCQFDVKFHLFVFLKSCIVASSWICVYYAMRELPVSIASPIRATSPIWTLIGGILFFGEIPTRYQACAMLLIFVGYYYFSVVGKLEGIDFFKSKGIFLILLGTLIGSVSALYDKFIIRVLCLDISAMQFWFSAYLVLVLGAAWGIRTCFGHKHPFLWRWSIPATGILLIIADCLYFYAVSVPGAQISILSLLRRCNCIVAFAAGALWLHDKNIRKKIFPLILILLGAAILALKI